MLTRPPVRIQRRCTRGWRMPEGAVYVGRPSAYGNPFAVAKSRGVLGRWVPGYRMAVARFRTYAVDRLTREPGWLEPLRGHDLACWEPAELPCHADVLLELANA